MKTSLAILTACFLAFTVVSAVADPLVTTIVHIDGVLDARFPGGYYPIIDGVQPRPDVLFVAELDGDAALHALSRLDAVEIIRRAGLEKRGEVVDVLARALQTGQVYTGPRKERINAFKLKRAVAAAGRKANLSREDCGQLKRAAEGFLLDFPAPATVDMGIIGHDI